MEMWNTSRIGVVNKRMFEAKIGERKTLGVGPLVLALLFGAILTGCGTPRKPHDPSTSVSREESAGGDLSGVYGPSPRAEEGSDPVSTTSNRIENPDRIVLVFGQGLSHGYAYIGALRALTELKIPVHAIYATEVGALAGALYYTQPNPNRMDWALLRFTEKNLRAPEGTFSFVRLNSPEQDLEGRLKEVFGTRGVHTLSDRLRVFLDDEKTGETVEPKSGELWRVVRAALSGVNGFSPMKIDGRALKSSSLRLSEVHRKAASESGYPVVVIGAGTQPAEVRREIENENGVFIPVDLPGIDDLDLKKRNQAMFFGKSAIQKSAERILGLVGRSSE
jgi:hypothetical protein